MKELSIEEKVKAYDKARARMSRAFNSNRCTIGFMNEIFPELAESEDERIRKELLAWLKSRDGQILPIDRYNAAISWLEKQGEQKPAEWTHKDGKNLAELWEILSVHRNTNPQVDNLMQWVKDLVSYKRQEWSEEDEKFFKTALWHISYSISNGKSTDTHCDTTDWFKSLKDRVQPQPTWKPSEEQMEALNDIFARAGAFDDVLLSLINDLKKLKE